MHGNWLGLPLPRAYPRALRTRNLPFLFWGLQTAGCGSAVPGGMLAAGANRASSRASHLIAKADGFNQNSRGGVLRFADKLDLCSFGERWADRARAAVLAYREASLEQGHPGGSPCF